MKLTLSARVAIVALGLTALLALSGTATADIPSSTATATASADRVAAVCAKRAARATAGAPRSAATTSKRRALARRCVRRMTQATTSRRRARDVTAPSLAWQAPTAGATVSGTVSGTSCLISASDDRGVDRVVIAVDGKALGTERYAPYECDFDTTTVADGAHTLTATAYDAAGNSRAAAVTVTVANAPAPTPEPEPEPEPASSPEPTPEADVTAPSVAWQAPTAGATVSGTLDGSDCLIAASDASGIDRVVISVDGAALATERYAPYDCTFDSTKVANGSHTFTATAFDSVGNSRTATATVTVSNTTAAPAPAPESSTAPTSSGSLVIGIDGGYSGWSSTETSYRAQLGAAVTRHEWDITAPVNQQDALVLKAASQVHTRIHALLGGNELGSASNYRDWVVAFIRRYGVGGSFWAEHPELDASRYAMTTFELGNEPYFGAMSASLYADTVRPTLEEVKRLGLPAKIILPSRVYGTDTSWMDTLYARIPNLNNLFYAFADHPYWYGHDPATVSAAGPFGRIDVLRRRMNEKGASSKPIYITEYGESTANCGSECVTEPVQAEHLKSMLNAAITRSEWKIEMVSVFQLLDRGTNSTDRELQFGLLRQNGTQKPSYSIVRERIQQFRG